MNILHIMEDYKPRIGGSVVRNASMIEAYKRNMDDTLWLINLAGKEYQAREEMDGIAIYRCKSLPEMIVTAHRIAKKNNIEILHAHNFRFMFAAFAVKFLAPERSLKVVTEMHALYRMKHFKERIAYCLLRKSNAIIVLADSAKRYLTETYGIDQNRISSLSNGMFEIRYQKNTTFEFYSKLAGLRVAYCIAGYFGTFYQWQGVLFIGENLTKILRECPHLYIVMMGDGPEFEKVKKQVEACPYKNRILLSKGIEKEQLYNLYELIDIIWIPRLKNLSTDTAIPLKAVEAMGFSKCILAGNDNGLKEVLNEKNAAIFESGNINCFIEQLKKLVADSALRAELGEKAREDSVRIFHTWDSNALQVRAIYERVKAGGS